MIRTGFVLTVEDLSLFLQCFAPAPITSLTIGSFDTTLHRRDDFWQIMDHPHLLPQERPATVSRIDAIFALVVLVAQFSLLEQLVVRFCPIVEGWADPLDEAQLTRSAPSYAGGGAPSSSPTALAKLQTARLFFAYLPALEALTLLDEVKYAVPAWVPATGDLNAGGDHTSWRKVGIDAAGRKAFPSRYDKLKAPSLLRAPPPYAGTK
ncbi:hypothetical protein JCM3770_001219 [Rhodotorula araucariae]